MQDKKQQPSKDPWGASNKLQLPSRTYQGLGIAAFVSHKPMSKCIFMDNPFKCLRIAQQVFYAIGQEWPTHSSWATCRSFCGFYSSYTHNQVCIGGDDLVSPWPWYSSLWYHSKNMALSIPLVGHPCHRKCVVLKWNGGIWNDIKVHMRNGLYDIGNVHYCSVFKFLHIYKSKLIVIKTEQDNKNPHCSVIQHCQLHGFCPLQWTWIMQLTIMKFLGNRL